MKTDRGQLIIFSGPSGVGKGTLLRTYLHEREDVVVSISATTRRPRPSEVDGVHYYFITEEEFLKKVEDGGMLEYARYNQNYYGTPKESVERLRDEGKDVILEIEVQGAIQVKELCPDALMIFVMPPTFEELARRLADRKTEDEETIRRRLETAKEELARAYEYDFIIVNDLLSEAVSALDAIVQANKWTVRNKRNFIDEVCNHV